MRASFDDFGSELSAFHRLAGELESSRRRQIMSQTRPHSEEEWKERYRAPQVLTSAVSWEMPGRGIAATNLSGTYQLHCWDVLAGQLTQLTYRPEGLVQGMLAPDGQFVYYFDDEQGKEIGHFVRVPYGTQAAESTDITPDLPLFSLPSSPNALAISRSG